MIVVTGAAGFIGSCIVARLNERGCDDLILVDHLNEAKKKNIDSKRYASYFDKNDFIEMIKEETLKEKISSVIHMGACSSTTLDDAQYYEENNYLYTRHLAQWCLKNQVRFIYASSAATYGDGSVGYKDDDDTILKCNPLNLYGLSKQKFDRWVLDNQLTDKMVGLKFFNVFGPNEYHKGPMRSVIAKAYKRVVEEGKMSLFKSYNPQYAHGEQKRDFIYVKDAVDVVLYFLDNENVNGIYNVGTGQAKSWNDLARALFAATNQEVNIEYIEMPENLKGIYQYFTQADMSKLFNSGYSGSFHDLDMAVKDYAGYLKDNCYL